MDSSVLAIILFAIMAILSDKLGTKGAHAYGFGSIANPEH